MEKRTYIQPEMNVAVLPKDAIMAPQPLAGSPTMSTVGAAPTRLAPANPALATDSVAVF